MIHIRPKYIRFKSLLNTFQKLKSDEIQSVAQFMVPVLVGKHFLELFSLKQSEVGKRIIYVEMNEFDEKYAIRLTGVLWHDLYL